MANKKQTSEKVASKASAILTDKKSPAKVKSVAASDLSQTAPSKAKKKGK